MVTVYVNLGTGGGLAGLRRYTKKLLFTTTVTHKAVIDSNNSLMNAFVKSAKLRAPRWSGYLASTIRRNKSTVTKDKSSFEAIVDAPYSIYQEEGYRPHFVPWFFPTGSGSIFQKYLGNGFKIGANVSKHKPFIGPAFFATAKKSAPEYERRVGTALKKHFR